MKTYTAAIRLSTPGHPTLQIAVMAKDSLQARMLIRAQYPACESILWMREG